MQVNSTSTAQNSCIYLNTSSSDNYICWIRHGKMTQCLTHHTIFFISIPFDNKLNNQGYERLYGLHITAITIGTMFIVAACLSLTLKSLVVISITCKKARLIKSVAIHVPVPAYREFMYSWDFECDLAHEITGQRFFRSKHISCFGKMSIICEPQDRKPATDR